MIPLKDENPTKNRCYLRYVILFICLVVFFFQISSSQSNLMTYYFGFKPASFFNNFDKPTFFPVLTLFTSLFMHGGWMHLIGNMMYLVIFADNIEDVFGKKKFILFYLFSGIFASFSQALLNLSSDVPMIGASGAIAGVLGAYLFYFPKAKILVLVPFFIFFTLRIPASILLIFWFIFQFLNLSNIESSVAWMAHIGGFIFGYIFSIINGKKPIQKKGSSIFLNKKKGPWD
ncbi:MAG: rhomboid family intramembrane serine protease [Alphaproteobacteria bacterium]